MRPSIEERVFAGWIKARPIRAYFVLDGYGLLGRKIRQNHHGEFDAMDGRKTEGASENI